MGIKFITVAELAKAIGYTRQAVARLCQHKVIRCELIGSQYIISYAEARKWTAKREAGKVKYHVFPRINFKNRVD